MWGIYTETQLALQFVGVVLSVLFFRSVLRLWASFAGGVEAIDERLWALPARGRSIPGLIDVLIRLPADRRQARLRRMSLVWGLLGVSIGLWSTAYDASLPASVVDAPTIDPLFARAAYVLFGLAVMVLAIRQRIAGAGRWMPTPLVYLALVVGLGFAVSAALYQRPA
jgi:hypothetical protein